MKTPEEIKESMQYGIDESFAIYDDESYCPGEVEVGFISVEDLEAALAYIQQLEAKVPKWINDEGSILCPYCGGTIRMIPAWQKSMPDMGGYMWSARGKCSACGSITPEVHGRTAKEANAAAYAAAQWGHVSLPKPPVEV